MGTSCCDIPYCSPHSFIIIVVILLLSGHKVSTLTRFLTQYSIVTRFLNFYSKCFSLKPTKLQPSLWQQWYYIYIYIYDSLSLRQYLSPLIEFSNSFLTNQFKDNDSTSLKSQIHNLLLDSSSLFPYSQQV